MFSFRNLFFSFVVLIVLSSFGLAQSKDFIAPDKSFTIALPNDSASIRVINPYPTVKGGNQFNWKIPQGRFSINYIDLSITPKNPKERLEKAADEIIQGTTKYGGKLVSKAGISYHSLYPGIEIRFLLSPELIVITRFYLFGSRQYNLNTGWETKEDGATQLKILDSFKVFLPKIKVKTKA